MSRPRRDPPSPDQVRRLIEYYEVQLQRTRSIDRKRRAHRALVRLRALRKP
jgi:hypothetical protein